MKEIPWDRQAVGEFLELHGGKTFVRMKEPRGWKANIRKRFSTVAGKCFRNSLYAAHNSNRAMYYCEGFAKFRQGGGWYAHAWCSPRHLELPDGAKWAIDLTWPFHSKYAIGENVDYFGLEADSEHVFEFFDYLRVNGVPEPSCSILKYLDHYKAFLSGMH